MYVKDLMTTSVVSLDADDDLTLAEDLMTSRKIRHLPVVDSKGHLVGLITRSDLLHTSLSALHKATAADRRMKEGVQAHMVMQAKVATVGPDTPLREAVRVLRDKKYGCLPVVTDGAKLVGIVTDTDFLRFAAGILVGAESQEMQDAVLKACQRGRA